MIMSDIRNSLDNSSDNDNNINKSKKKDDGESTVVIVKHLPTVLSDVAIHELFQHVGATSVRLLKSSRATAFATFDDAETAARAIQILDKLSMLGSTLHAEFAEERGLDREALSAAIEPQKQHHHQQQQQQPQQRAARNEEAITTTATGSQLPPPEPIAPELGVHYAPNPLLEYKYPEPNEDILCNILSALVDVPRFYEQVLHLMNKMNLPPPFRSVKSVPSSGSYHSVLRRHEKRKRAEADELLSSEESEIESSESSDENEAMERETIEAKRNRKRARVESTTSGPQNIAIKRRRVTPDSTIQQQQQYNKTPQLQIRLRTLEASESVGGSSTTSSTTASATIETINNDEQHQTMDMAARSLQAEQASSGGDDGFGSAASVIPSSVVEDVIPPRNVMGREKLRDNRLSKEQIEAMPRFSGHEFGEPTNKLYLKNLHGSVTQDELRHIYGSFFASEQQLQRDLVVDVKKGKMKGQAFVTLATPEMATEALHETHGYLLRDKPIVVQFARRTQPKPPQQAT